MICGAFGLDKSRRTHAFRQGLTTQIQELMQVDNVSSPG